MKRKYFSMRLVSFLLTLILVLMPSISAIGVLPVHAAETKGSGSIATTREEVVGTWSYYTKEGVEVVNQNKDLLNKLPYKTNTQYRYTTANYDANNGAFDTTNWATSFMWSTEGDNPYSMSVYAFPLAFRAGVTNIDGPGYRITNAIQVTAPSALSDYNNKTFTMQMPSNGTCTDFFIRTNFATSAAKVDSVTDWSYDIHLEKEGDANTYLSTKMVQGSVFAYFELVGDDSLTIERGKNLDASVCYTSPEGNVIIVKCYDNMDEDYDYYAFYGAQGTTYNTSMNGTRISSITVNFSGGKYFSLAYLGSSPKNPNDSWAENMCAAFKPYAYNFVTDTRATYSFNEATGVVSTTYAYSFDKKAESKADGTIMGVLPHQYKHIASGTDFLSYTYATARGTLKTIAGSSFTTYLSFSGILPFMPSYTDDANEKNTIKAYLDDFTNNFGTDYFKNYEGNGDTYWNGKGMNRLANAMAAAEVAGDSRASGMLDALKAELTNWFTYSGAEDTAYFYYDSDIGSLFGFPQSYNSVDQINDHHFHYGYFIYAAAQIALRDPEWAEQYKDVVNELIYDIACPERNSASSRYPYLRSFQPYEGHSYASGHGNFDMGNNQESSSEALNAWAGIVLWGAATGNTAIRDLGIYLYTTEVSAVQNYWYDVDGDVLDARYIYNVSKASDITASSQRLYTSSAIVWGGSYTYATWFSANPLYIQGINLLPMNPTCFYLAQNRDYLLENYNLAYKYAVETTDGGKAWDIKSWFDIWCQYYAMAEPEAALAKWQATESAAGSYGVEGGETKAHTYHFIKTLCTYGIPDTSITSDTIMSNVFVKDGVKTYCAFNPSATEKTITFSDGYKLKVAPHSMGVAGENSSEDQARYVIEYYVENNAGTYDKKKEVSKYGTVGETVTTGTLDEIAGYEYDSANASNVTSTTLAKSGTILKVYFNRCTYTISYELNGGVQDANNPTSYKYGETKLLYEPTKEGLEFTGWYMDEALSTKLESISDTTKGNLRLYAGWNDPYVYQLDSKNRVTYDGTTITLTHLDNSATRATVYYKFFSNESEFSSIIQEPGVAGFAGANLTANAETGLLEIKFTSGFSANQFLVFKLNVDNAETSWGVYEIPDGVANKVTYYESFYKENADGTFSLAETSSKKVASGTNVVCSEKDYPGYVFDETNGENVLNATVDSSGITLKRYYKRATYNINYNLNGGTNAAGNPTSYKYGTTASIDAPTKEHYEFAGWYTDSALTSAFTGITSTTSGEINLYAKWNISDDSMVAGYTVKHYKETAKDSGVYTLVDTDVLSGVIGETVNATPKAYTDYEENISHANRVASGTIVAGGSLVLALYYDSVKEITSGGDAPTELFGVRKDAEGKVELYVEAEKAISGQIGFYAICDDKTASDAITAIGSQTPGYNMNKQSDGSYTYPLGQLSDDKYVVYAFNGGICETPVHIKVSDIPVAGGSGATPVTEAQYTVKYYQQNTALNGYEEVEADRVVTTGTVSAEVFAPEKSYDGFTKNTSVMASIPSGYVLADGSLVLAVYYDRNSYTITYHNVDGATNANATEYVYGVGLTLLDATKIDAAFEGWYSDSELTSKITSVGATEMGNKDVYAKWNTTANYTVRYYQQNKTCDGYDEVTADTVITSGNIGATVNAPDKSYNGFTKNTSVSNSATSGVVLADGSLELRVYFDRNVYDITYENVAGATNPNAATYVYGVGLTLQDATKDGFTFNGWFADAEFNTAITEISATSMNTVVVYAKFTENPTAANYTVKYYQQNTECNGYNEVTADTVTIVGTIGSNVTAPTKVYTGFTETTVTGTVKSGIVAADGSLVLKVFYNRNQYTITYHNVEGAINENETSFVYGVGTTLQNASKANAVFEGWYKEAEFTNQITSIGTDEAANVDVYAKWRTTADYTVEHYKQTAGLNAYTKVDSETLSGTIGATVNAVAKEYTGFSVDEDAEDGILMGTIAADGSLVLKVYYNRNRYTITYNNMEGATNPNAKTYVYGVGMTLQNPTKEGFAFKGWYTDEECTDEITAISSTQTGAVEVYAKWETVGTGDGDEGNPGTGDGNEGNPGTGDGNEGNQGTGDGDEGNQGTGDGDEGNQGTGDGDEGNPGTGDGDEGNPGTGDGNEGNPGTGDGDEGNQGTGDGDEGNQGTGDGNEGNQGTGDGDEGNQGTGDGNEGNNGNNKPGTDDEYESPEYNFDVDKIEDQVYTGGKITPNVIVRDGNAVLIEKRDYTVKFTNNVAAGQAGVVITGKGNYTGSVTKYFNIIKKDINLEEFSADDIYVAYNKGRSLKVSPKLKWGTKTLKLNKDYSIKSQTSYSSIGEYTVTLEGIGNFTGTRELLFVVTDKPLMAKASVKKIAKQYYNEGKEIKPVVEVSYKKVPLTENKDYTVEYVNNTATGVATVIIKGTGTEYVGEKKVTFKILGTALKSIPINLAATNYEYTGESIEPAYTCGTLKEGTDFTVSYTNNVKVGKGTVTFTGINGYSGTVKKTFKITGYNIGNNSQKLFEDKTGDLTVAYEKGGATPHLTLKLNGNLLTEGVDYTLKYSNNNQLGTGTITVTGKGRLSGKYIKTFTIEKADISESLIMASDVAYKAGKNAAYYMTNVMLYDVNGKMLKGNVDYDPNVTYEFAATGTVLNENSSLEGLAVGTEITVTAKGTGNYEGEVSCTYQIIQATKNIKSAKVSVAPQVYTGKAVYISEDEIKVTLKGVTLDSSEYEIVEGSYRNNTKKGTAKVTIRGIDEYGGYKTVSFKIQPKGVGGFIGNIFSSLKKGLSK